jgi:hypothetical protein
VFIYDDDVSIPYELGTIFVLDEDEDFFHNHRFTVEQTEFKFKAKIKSR